jgi:hypothetical protein
MALEFRRSLLLMPLGCLVLGVLASCDNPAGPPPVACSQSTIFSGDAQVSPGIPHVQSLTTTSTGALHVAVDWSREASVMNLVIAQSPCTTEQLQASSCNVITSLWSPPKPMVASTTLLPAGTYVVLVGNPNAVEESISTRVVLISAGCPAS